MFNMSATDEQTKLSKLKLLHVEVEQSSLCYVWCCHHEIKHPTHSLGYSSGTFAISMQCMGGCCQPSSSSQLSVLGTCKGLPKDIFLLRDQTVLLFPSYRWHWQNGVHHWRCLPWGVEHGWYTWPGYYWIYLVHRLMLVLFVWLGFESCTPRSWTLKFLRFWMCHFQNVKHLKFKVMGNAALNCFSSLLLLNSEPYF